MKGKHTRLDIGKWNTYLLLVQVKTGAEVNEIDLEVLCVSLPAPQSIDHQATGQRRQK